jgi:hypothetical protein
MNIRKWLCGFARPGSWLYRAADCQRYRPAEVITEHVEVTDTATGEVSLPPKSKYPLYCFIPELMVAEGNLNEFCKKFRAAGGHGIRFFLLQSWSNPLLFPWRQAQMSDGRSIWIDIPDENLRTAVTDMDSPNQEYWDRLAVVLDVLARNDLDAIVSLGDNCSLNTHQQFLSYPFLASLDTMSNEIIPYVIPVEAQGLCTESPGGLYGPDKYERFRDWVRAALDAIYATGVQFKVEVQNEFSRLGWEPSAQEPYNWYKMIVDELVHDAVLPSQIVNSGDLEIAGAAPGLYSMHQIEQPDMFPYSGDFHWLMLSGDGGYAGPFAGDNWDDMDCEGRRGLSVESARGIARMIREKGIDGGYEWMPKKMWRYSDYRANVDDIPMDVPRAMTEEWK